MASKRPIVQRPVAQLPSGYAALLDDIKAHVRAAQLRVGLTGRGLNAQRQKTDRWDMGTKSGI
jgi:hypothetical protein